MKTLNVILHGNIVLLIKKTYLKGFIPDFGARHSYRAGPWLAETTLEPRREYALEGVQSGNATFKESENMILRGVIENRDAKPYATLILPKPQQIWSVGRVKFQPDCGLIGDDLDMLRPGASGGARDAALPSILSTVQILSYSFDKLGDMRLGNHDWKKYIAEESVNLHIFAEPDSNAHLTSDDFAGGLDMFRKPDHSKIDVYPISAAWVGTAQDDLNRGTVAAKDLAAKEAAARDAQTAAEAAANAAAAATSDIDAAARATKARTAADAARSTAEAARAALPGPDTKGVQLYETEGLYDRTARLFNIGKDLKTRGTFQWDPQRSIGSDDPPACGSPIGDTGAP